MLLTIKMVLLFAFPYNQVSSDLCRDYLSKMKVEIIQDQAMRTPPPPEKKKKKNQETFQNTQP